MKLSSIAIYGSTVLILSTLPSPMLRPVHAQGSEPSQNRPAHPSAATSSQNPSVQRAPQNADERGLEKLEGKRVRGVNGEQVGKLEDVFVDIKTGKAVLAVVASGGVAGIGGTLRIVPVQALELDSNLEGFTTPVREANWNKLPVIKADEFESGRINLAADDVRAISDSYFHIDRDDDTSDYGKRIIRASTLRGKSVQAGQQEVGEIEDVIVNFAEGGASALVETESRFAGSEGPFLVPLARLQMNAEQDTIATNVTKADFQNATRAPQKAGAPTGRTP